jgi:pilus assembly protein Flp/PilA
MCGTVICLHPVLATKGPSRDITMKNIALHIRRFLASEDGPTAVEYAVMLALIIVVCLTAITTLGQRANDTFNNVALDISLAAGS